MIGDPSARPRWRFALAWAWAVCAIAFAALGLIPPQALTPTPGLGESYYVIRTSYGVSLVAAFALFGAIYAVLEGVRLPYRRPLGYAHLALMTVGAVLIVCPAMLLGWVETPETDTRALFGLFNVVASAGYILTLIGLLAFAGLFVDAAITAMRRKRRA